MPPKSRTTKPSTPRLSEVARHVVAPKSGVTTGWPAVEKKCQSLGVKFRWWQKPIGQIILSKNAAGKYTTTIGGTGLSIPRQVGKTFLVGMIVFALCMLRPNLTVVWSAHRLRTAEETFKKLQALTQRRLIKPHIKRVVLGSGEEAIEFHNGSRILFGARAAGFGRGFDEVDVVVYDEAQILGDNALDDMVPAMNQSRQPEGALLLFMGTPPKPTDPGQIFTRMRTEALSGEDEDTAWIEFGADPGYAPTELPEPLTEADWAQVAKANPSYPDDTPRESILRMRKKLGAESFLREGLGIWDAQDSDLVMPSWSSRATHGDPPRPTVVGLAHDRERVWISVAAAAPGYVGAVMRVRAAGGRGLALAEVARICYEYGIPVAIDVKDQPLADDLAAVENPPRTIPAGFDDYIQSCSDLYDAVEGNEVHHGDHDALNLAVAAAGWSGGERRKFIPKRGEISMLKAAALAHWGESQAKPPPPNPRRIPARIPAAGSIETAGF